MKCKISYLLLLLGFSLGIKGQLDSLSIIKHKKIIMNHDSDLVFTGTRITEKADSSEYSKLKISGYISAYYAYYTDEIEKNGFVQFPTMAARNNQFGLNIAQIGMNYLDKNVRANLTLHYGDIPESNWPKPFTIIQEANAGVKIIKNVWLDVGFFKTHIGLESTQPRENITSSMSVINNYEPYFFSGAKLTYLLTSKLSLQLNAFNGFNTFVETNKNKALGFSALYDVNDKISITYNFLTCDETPNTIKTKHQRFYNNVYGTIKLKKWNIGFEANYGSQQNTLLTDTTKIAITYSGLIVAKYQFVSKIGVYGRAEYFADKNKILTNNLDLGNNIYGGTIGIEYKPFKKTALSLEYRLLQCDNLIFKYNNYYTNQRNDFIVCLDVWF